MRQKPVAALVLAVVLLLVAGVLWARYRHASKPTVEARPVRCEACGTEYVPKTGDPDEPCPVCGSTSHVIVLWYRCRDCGHEFVGYEQNPADGTFRTPGGEWTPLDQLDPETALTCPQCGSKRASSIKRPSESQD